MNAPTTKQLVSQFEDIAAQLGKAVTGLEDSDLERVIQAKWRLSGQINEASCREPGREIEWFTRRWPAQSRCFVIDYFPELQEILLRTYKRADTIRLLDVGAATGAGPSLIGELFATDMLWCRIKVDAIDLSDRRKLFSANNYRDFSYLVGDIFALGEASYEIVTCSHVIEHVLDVDRFLLQLRKIARHHVVVYAPYAEKELIPGHRNQIDEGTFAKHSPVSMRVVRSLGWRAGHPDYRCIVAVLPSLNGPTK